MRAILRAHAVRSRGARMLARDLQHPPVKGVGKTLFCARKVAGLATTIAKEHTEMGPQLSILLHHEPSSVRARWETADHDTPDREGALLALGIWAYSKTGIIGRPSLATQRRAPHS